MLVQEIVIIVRVYLLLLLKMGILKLTVVNSRFQLNNSRFQQHW